MALPFLKQTDTTHLVSILRYLYLFTGQGVLEVVNLGLGIAREELAAVLHSHFWCKTGGKLHHLRGLDKTLIQHFL